MDRLQTKCLVASAGFHGLLAAVLAGSSVIHLRPRLNRGSPDTDAAIIQLVSVPADLGSPASSSTSRQIELPPLSTSGPKGPDTPQRSSPARNSSPDSTAPGHREFSHSTRNNGRLLEMSRMLEDMANRVPTGKAIELEIGSGEPGKDDAYARIVKFFYSQSWEPAAENDPKIAAKAKVTIASDGKVSSARIVQSSGNTQLDESVQRTLDRVQFIEPFEPGAKESQRSYTINFRVGMTGVAAD